MILQTEMDLNDTPLDRLDKGLLQKQNKYWTCIITLPVPYQQQ